MRCTSLVASLVVGLAPILALGCECDRGEGAAAGEPGTERTTETAEDDPRADEDEAAPTDARPIGPIGRLVAPFDDEIVDTHLVVLRRTGTAEGTLPDDAPSLGSGWIAGVERELRVLEERAAEGRTATLFGPVGACEARVLRELALRSGDDRYEGVEVAPCEGISVETLESTYPFGVEGPVTVEELSSRTMTAPADDVAAAVAEAERTAGDGEEMDLLARGVGETGVSIVAGWSTHVVRGGVVVESFEDGIPAYVVIGARILLLARRGRETTLLEVGAEGLSPVTFEPAP
jgi:hypothetical protein